MSTVEPKPSDIESLIDEFTDELRGSERPTPDFDEYLKRCPESHRKELRSLMNMAALTHRVLGRLRTQGEYP